MIAEFFFLLLLAGAPGQYTISPVELMKYSDSDSPSEYNGKVGRFRRSASSSGNASSVELPDDDQQMPNKTTTKDENIKSDESCTFLAVANHLNLTKDNIKYTLSRPVRNYSNPVEAALEMVIYAILDVRETDQTFISYIWVYLIWKNEFISWDPEEFCGIKYITVPIKYMWMPDITIEEMTEKDKASPSPYLTIYSEGSADYRNDQVVLSTCKMHVYKFPFDVQSCNLSFRSIIHTDKELQLSTYNGKNFTFELSQVVMRTQYEWLFLNVTVTNRTNTVDIDQATVVYTITMKRRPIFYIANFILPVLFFLCLDLGSFLISDSGGEKLSFKVTVLLAVTVMQLILKDILPSSSDRVPLIAVYCIGLFILMLLSLLETILVMHLYEKDMTSQNDETDGDRSSNENCWGKWSKASSCSCFRGIKKSSHCASVDDASADETQSVTKEVSSSNLMEVSFTMEKISDELGEIRNLLTSNRKAQKSGYWTRMAKKINKNFLIFYVTAVIVFLVVIFSLWMTSADDAD